MNRVEVGRNVQGLLVMRALAIVAGRAGVRISLHNLLEYKRLLHTTPRTQNLGLVPCCTATKLSSMTLLYMDKDNSWTEKIIPNMIVESCGCM
ncbi:unnamed protein product [Bemisia tabaci]|uniref:TGF-beta family profile domain-containing protein n=1 Tax=Bemisia tabaci TaxID=7038 RepID=A0A9P0F7I5_BEMTA|nr:unnamed protein product [Bemisia tabaci]